MVTKVSCEGSGKTAFLARLNADKIFARELQVENAYHSHHMEVVAQPYLRSIADAVAEPAGNDDSISTDIEMISSVTGQLVRPSELSPEYWVRNLVSPVLFADAVTAMLRKPSRGLRQRRKAEPTCYISSSDYNCLVCTFWTARLNQTISPFGK